MLEEYAAIMGVTPDQITEKNNRPAIVEVRSIYCKLRHEKHGYNYSQIGRELGRTHASVIHAIRRMNDLLSVGDEEVTRKWNKVKQLREYEEV